MFLSPSSKSLFPLQSIGDLEKFFELECVSKDEPNLSLLSIVLGAIEHSLVSLEYSGRGGRRGFAVGGGGGGGGGGVKRKRGGRGGGKVQMKVEYKDVAVAELASTTPTPTITSSTTSKSFEEKEEEGLSDKENFKGDFPPLELHTVEAFFLKFYDILKTFVELEEDETGRNLKKVSDVVWSYLSRSYKADSPHIQSLYTYLTGKKLDSFGVTLAVVAGSQLLGLKDVHLVLSEDHSWVGYGNDENRKTAEVTWHGKGIEDKRGKEVGIGDDENSWLYLKGHAVYCTRHMEVAAIVTSMNYVIQGSMCSTELMKIQQKFLWRLYDSGHLKKFPLALTTLADLEEIISSGRLMDCPSFHKEAVLSCRTYYNDMHIFPYTAFAAYCFRKEDYKTALKYWANAARIVQKYRRSKNDEEIYREFFEISTDYLGAVMKTCSTGFSAHLINRNPMCFAHLLRFFDGICSWEERSKSSIVHVTWAKGWLSAIGKFDYTIRRMVKITESSLENCDKEITNGTESDLNGEEEDSPSVTFFSHKMRQLKGFFKLEKYNPGGISLILTAQTATDETEKEANGVGPSGRSSSRRERLSQNAEHSTKNENEANGVFDKAQPKKKTKLAAQ